MKNTAANAEIALLRRQLAEATAPKPHAALTLKVSEKGGVSVYGLGRFPVTLYKEQWTRLVAIAPNITEFLAANASALKSKPA